MRGADVLALGHVGERHAVGDVRAAHVDQGRVRGARDSQRGRAERAEVPWDGVVSWEVFAGGWDDEEWRDWGWRW